MLEKSKQSAPRSVLSIYPALVIVIVAIGLLIWSQNYGETARRFPSFVAVVLMGLGLIDLWSRTKLPGQTFIKDFWGTSFDRREMDHSPPLKQELGLLLWIVGCFAGMATVGILATVPVFCFAFTWLRSKRPLVQSVLVALGILVFEYVVFEWLLDYTLYRGLFFSKGGLSRW